MDKLEKLKEEIKEETYLSEYMDLKKASLDIPYLHSKYLQKCEGQRMLSSMVEDQVNILYLKKRMYYLGKADPNTYKAKPLDNTILKSDVDMWIKADEEYINLTQKLKFEQSILKILEETVSRISRHSFYINNYVDLLKFENGID